MRPFSSCFALSLLVVYHGVTLSSWSMSFAKYLTVVLGREIRRLGNVATTFPSFDHWDGDIKAHAVRTRAGGYLLWFFVVLSTCSGSLTVVNWRTYYESGWIAKTFIIVGGAGIALLLMLTLHAANTGTRRRRRDAPRANAPTGMSKGCTRVTVSDDSKPRRTNAESTS